MQRRAYVYANGVRKPSKLQDKVTRICAAFLLQLTKSKRSMTTMLAQMLRLMRLKTYEEEEDCA